jgi:dihydrofolate synthase/folylpolyglutamate synthase
MAMVYFEEKPLDYVILETGLGGRLDATNIVSPVLNIITSIGMDHMQYLGDTIEKIAGEKAGIITSDVPVIFNTGSDIADSIILGKCEIKDVETCIDAEDTYVDIIKADTEKIDFSLDNSYYNYDNLRLRTPALYQIKNAETAIMAAHLLLKKIDRRVLTEAVYKGIYNFKWAARMEYLRDNLIIDGAHNEDAAKVFVETAKNIFDKGEWRKKSILFAVSQDKDYDSVIKIISEGFDPDKVFVTQFNSSRTLDTDSVRETFEKYFSKYDITVYKNLDEAVEMLKNIPEDEIVFAVGSLYLAGELREKMEIEQTSVEGEI